MQKLCEFLRFEFCLNVEILFGIELKTLEAMIKLSKSNSK